MDGPGHLLSLVHFNELVGRAAPYCNDEQIRSMLASISTPATLWTTACSHS
jgi:hypothetical protein